MKLFSLRSVISTLTCVALALFLVACAGTSGGGGNGGGGTSAPDAPTGLAATAGNAQVSLTWNASAKATSYSVQRGTVNGGPYTQIATPAATNYTDTGLTNGSAYFYVVLAVNSAGISPNSNQVSATPVTPAQPPAAPTGLIVTAGNAQVNLSWIASANATSYNVKRSVTKGGPYATIASPTTTSYSDTGVTNGTTYFYVVTAVNANGESANSNQVSATPTAPAQPPAAPTGLAETAGNAQVNLSWIASTNATSYNVKRSVTNGGPYATIASPTKTNYSDLTVTNGTTYYYVVTAVNAAGESANSNQVSATPTGAAGTAVQVNVDALSNRHAISPYVYGTNFPADSTAISDTGMTLVRWGGNASSRYNWVNFDTNAANDYYYINRTMGSAPLYSDSTQFAPNVIGAGGSPIMTIPMLAWVAKDQTSYSFSVAKYGAQCSTDPYNSDAGNGVESNCSTDVTGNNPTDADVSLLDGPPAGGDPAGSVYRDQWLAALAPTFGNNQPHFYDMDNEIDIWGSTHRDVHPNPSGYNELRDTFINESRGVKTWDPQAIRFGPVSCCWWFYWNGANGNDKGAHAGDDFLPWWVNEVYWSDEIANTRSVDVIDIHAYPDAPDTLSSMTHAQQQAAALRIFRDYWDPTYISESSDINQPWATQIQPLKTIPFRIPRLRAMINMIYPGTPLSFTEWNAAFAGESDFSTALSDADAYGILGRERMAYAARWTSPVTGNPNYLALKLFRNYNGSHGAFGITSISATHNADPDLFSVYAALSQSATSMTVVVLNKDPANATQVTFALNHFAPSSFTAYSLSQTSPNAIVASASQSWSATQTFAPYTATLLVINGSISAAPAADWDINPDTIQAAAGATIALAPKIISATGNATVTLQSAQFDSGYTAGGTITIPTAIVTQTANGAISVAAGTTAGFYHFTVTGQDSSGVTQTQGGWILIGNPPATLTKTGDNQSGGVGTNLTLSVTLNPGSSGGTNSGGSILFTTSAGNFAGASRQIVVTNGSGVASTTLTLPASSGTVTVTAEGPYGLGHPVVTFTETAN
jgi:fibronectin type 3 domain-containing protein